MIGVVLGAIDVGELLPGLRIVGPLLRRGECALDARRTSAALMVAEDVADTGAAGSDAEGDEADAEHQREGDEHPFRVAS